MRFWKYHGIGNDFIVLDGSAGDLEVDTAGCRKHCDRNYGIGADGVLYLLPGDGTDISMRIINADGTEAEMCGNGIRCIAKHAYDFGIVGSDRFTVRTGAGDLDVRVATGPDGKVSAVQVDMGAPVLEAREVPVDADGRFIDRPFEANGIAFRASAVSMGNPHFITFSNLSDDQVQRLGPILESHPFFPKRTNEEFRRVVDGTISVKVDERGAAWTLACGTGACAAAVAAAMIGLVPMDTPVEVRLPGGWLRITVGGDLEHVLMEGPAELVYDGNIDW